MAKIIIVGAGVAGLSAGIYSRLFGHETVIFEKHHIAGGNLSGWRRGDYYIDNCIHWLTGTNETTSTYRMWKDTGMLSDGVDIFKPDSLYTAELDGQSLSLCRDINKLEEDMIGISPEDEKEIRSFIEAIKAAQKLLDLGGGINKPYKLLKYFPLTTGQLAERFKHPLIKRFIRCFIGDKFGVVAMFAAVGSFCSGNADIPYGGSFAAAQRLIDRYKELGGKLYTGREVVKAEDGRVVFSDGSEETGDYIVITAEPKSAIGKILDGKLPRAVAKRYEDKRLLRFSSVQCAFAIDDDRKLFDGDLIVYVPEEYAKELGVEHVAFRSYYYEKGFAPEGQSVYQCMMFCGEKTAREYISLGADREAYAEKKRRISEIVAKLFEGRFPEFSGRIKILDVWTPSTYRRYTDSETGSYMSFLFPGKYIPVHVSGKAPGYRGIFFAGQWLCPPGGLPNAAKSGKLAAEKINATEARAARGVSRRVKRNETKKLPAGN